MSQSQMHRCLRVPELLDIIFENVQDDLEFSRKNFFSLALTCRLFCEPALDRLWAVLPSIRPFLSLFPVEFVCKNDMDPDTFEWLDEEVDHKQFVEPYPYHLVTLTRRLEVADWSRITLLARRIREMDVGPYPYCDLRADNNFLDALEDSRLDGHWSSPMLPNLQVLKYAEKHFSSFLPIDFLFGPSVKSLFFRYTDAVFTRLDSLLCARQTCSSISNLTICGEYDEEIDDAESRVLSAFICSLNYLERVRFMEADLDNEALCHVMSQNNLKAFCSTEECFTAIISLLEQGRISCRPFPSLRAFEVSAESLDTCTRFFRSMSTPLPVTSLDFTVYDSPTQSHFLDFLHVLPNGCSFTDLITLKINIHSEPDLDSPYSFNDSAHAPLFQFRNLEVLIISGPILFLALDDAVIVKASAAWPNLQILKIEYPRDRIYFPSGPRRSTKVTLKGVASLASFQNLTELSIPFDSSQFAIPLINQCQHRLQRMTFAMSSLAEAFKSIEFLCRVFPGMNSVDAYNDHSRVEYEQMNLNKRNWDLAQTRFLQLRGGDGVNR